MLFPNASNDDGDMEKSSETKTAMNLSKDFEIVPLTPESPS